MKFIAGAFERPLIVGFSVFLLVFLGGIVFTFILGLVTGCEPLIPDERCDPSMAAILRWEAWFLGSGALGIVLGVSAAWTLSARKRTISSIAARTE